VGDNGGGSGSSPGTRQSRADDIVRYGEAYWRDFYDNCLVIGWSARSDLRHPPDGRWYSEDHQTA